MVLLKTISVLALGGTAMALPRPWGGHGNWQSGGWGSWGNWGNHGSDSTDVAAATTPAEAATPTVTFTAVATETAVQAFPTGGWSQPSSAPAAPAAPAATSAWGAAPSAAPAGGYMGIVNEWRQKMGLSDLTEDSTLVANADKTATDDNGVMSHELNPGSFAQVLAPGSMDNFESIFVGGWLCEKPNMAGLGNVCDTMAKGWDHSDGETGHADILTSGNYHKIGCACVTGICGCDLA